MTEPRIFHLQRDRDVSGVSGTGRVANGVLWPDGTVSLRWIGERPSTVHWDRLADAEHVHGHGGATRIVWADEQPDRAGLREHVAEAVLGAVEAAMGDTLLPAARREALAGIVAALPAPADRAAVLREAAERYAKLTDQNEAYDREHGQLDETARLQHGTVRDVVTGLRRMADETATTQTQPEPCAHCGQPIRRITGTLAAWWVHDPGGNTVCDWARPASSTRATPKTSDEPAAKAGQGEVWPVKDSTRRYAEELRATPGQASADGHTGWECDAGASLLVAASTPGPGALGTHHGTIYACATHRGAAVERITGAGYEADPQPTPPGHRWNPWPCGHVTAHDRAALTALTAADARQDGTQP